MFKPGELEAHLIRACALHLHKSLSAVAVPEDEGIATPVALTVTDLSPTLCCKELSDGRNCCQFNRADEVLVGSPSSATDSHRNLLPVVGRPGAGEAGLQEGAGLVRDRHQSLLECRVLDFEPRTLLVVRERVCQIAVASSWSMSKGTT